MTSITIPEGVTHIEGGAFRGNKLTKVTLPKSLVYIGDGAFVGNKLTNITIPDGVTYLGGFGKNDIASVVIPKSVRTIGRYAFGGRESEFDPDFSRDGKLTQVTIPEGVTHIEGGAFSGNQLTKVTLPKSLVYIGYGAFSGQKEGYSITIGANVAVDRSYHRAPEDDFGDFYAENGKKAGRYYKQYTYGSWTYSAK
ncbi:MAG: leucine-rich repeat domain-containing protein [Treponematales bacterium]